MYKSILLHEILLKKKTFDTVIRVIFKEFSSIFIVRFIEKSSSNRLRKSINVKILIHQLK